MNGEPLRILLVEDDEAHVDLIRRAFRSAADPVALITSATLKDAQERLKEFTPDLVITDLRLPEDERYHVSAEYSRHDWTLSYRLNASDIKTSLYRPPHREVRRSARFLPWRQRYPLIRASFRNSDPRIACFVQETKT